MGLRLRRAGGGCDGEIEVDVEAGAGASGDVEDSCGK